MGDQPHRELVADIDAIAWEADAETLALRVRQRLRGAPARFPIRDVRGPSVARPPSPRRSRTGLRVMSGRRSPPDGSSTSSTAGSPPTGAPSGYATSHESSPARMARLSFAV